MADKKKRLQLLAYVTGSINQELLLRNEYLAAGNRILNPSNPRAALTERLVEFRPQRGRMKYLAMRDEGPPRQEQRFRHERGPISTSGNSIRVLV